MRDSKNPEPSIFHRCMAEDTSLSSSEQGKAFNPKPGHDHVQMIVGGRIF